MDEKKAKIKEALISEIMELTEVECQKVLSELRKLKSKNLGGYYDSQNT